MTDRADVEGWVRRYAAAWASNEPADVRGLFTEDGEYRFHPWDAPIRGNEAIVAAWLENADEADDHTFQWALVAVDGDVAVVQGHTVYSDGDVYENLWVIELADDGRARAFTEWFMEPPAAWGSSAALQALRSQAAARSSWPRTTAPSGTCWSARMRARAPTRA